MSLLNFAKMVISMGIDNHLWFILPIRTRVVEWASDGSIITKRYQDDIDMLS